MHEVTAQDTVKAPDHPLSPSSDGRAISEETLKQISRLAQELPCIQPDENRSSLKQAQVQPSHHSLDFSKPLAVVTSDVL